MLLSLTLFLSILRAYNTKPCIYTQKYEKNEGHSIFRRFLLYIFWGENDIWQAAAHFKQLHPSADTDINKIR